MAHYYHRAGLATISTPGHTKMDTSIFNQNDLFTSLTYLSDWDNVTAPYPITDPVQYRSSLQKMKKQHIQFVLLAHHGVHEVGVENWETLIQKVRDIPKTVLTVFENAFVCNKYVLVWVTLLSTQPQVEHAIQDPLKKRFEQVG